MLILNNTTKDYVKLTFDYNTKNQNYSANEHEMISVKRNGHEMKSNKVVNNVTSINVNESKSRPPKWRRL